MNRLMFTIETFSSDRRNTAQDPEEQQPTFDHPELTGSWLHGAPSGG
jgi:hypothetical protein